jgi:hypothetical protein
VRDIHVSTSRQLDAELTAEEGKPSFNERQVAMLDLRIKLAQLRVMENQQEMLRRILHKVRP